MVDWRDFFRPSSVVMGFDDHGTAICKDMYFHEAPYQAYKARLMEELQIPAPETPEEYAAWMDKMVMKK